MIDSNKVTKRWVWVPCGKDLYKPAYIISESNNKTEVQSDSREIFNDSEIFKVNPSKFDRSEDLAELSHLNEPSVLHNLKTRYDDSLIYTYSGLFLIALNPYRNLGIYNDDAKRKTMRLKGRSGDPHIYAVANEAYRCMISNKANQSILITGESGAGKTENTKRVIEFLAFAAGRSRDKIEEGVFSIDDALVSANPLLEAFGNAKTIKNDNSSRFGKFIQIKFKGGSICGAKIEKYLLEKSRVAYQNSNERNFHIFYYLLAGLEQEIRDQYFLTKDPKSYKCLRNSVFTIPNVDDAEEFGKLCDAFKRLEIESSRYFKVIAAIMHLSNIEFTEKDDRASISDPKSLEWACTLLGLSFTDMMNAILHPVMKAGSEYVTRYRTKDQCNAVIEGAMKMLYEGLFDHLIAAVNKKLDTICDTYIGILDIAGFEIFKKNSFEQLCINYTNEKLQQFFNHHMFILEQEIYRTENIDWNFIDFGLDLEPTIRSIEGSNPIGILAYIDEECVMPGANDSTLLSKLKSVNQVQDVQFKPNFIIKHYAGNVEYEVKDWLSKNRDVECEPILDLININDFLSDDSSNSKQSDSNFKSQLFGVKKGSFKTVSQCHKENLRNLMSTLSNTQPHFVRCILPNLQKKPDLFDKRLILDQLRCNGVLEGIRISRLGYPSRLPFSEFNSRYEILLSSNDQATCIKNQENNSLVESVDLCLPREKTAKIISSINISTNDCKIGNSMVFFRQGILADIEDMRDKRIYSLAKTMHLIIRFKLEQRKSNMDAMRLEAVLSLQRNARMSLNLLRWKWWALYQKIGPLLEVKKSESDIRMRDEQIQAYVSLVEQAKSDAKLKDEEISKLTLVVNDLNSCIKSKDNLICDNEDLILGLRTENSKIKSEVERLGNSLKSEKELIMTLRDKIDQSAVKEANHSKEFARINSEMSVLKENLKKREAEIEMIAKEDLKSVLKGREKEIAELKKVVEDQSGFMREKDMVIKKLSDEKKDESNKLAIAEEQLRITESTKNELHSELTSVHKLIEKYKMEINDLQLENDGLRTKNGQYEHSMTESGIMIGDLKRELEFQKTKCTGLESSIAMLKSIPVPEPRVEVPIQVDNNARELKTLKQKLANEEKISKRLLEEKEILYSENLKLMQSKLDELFNSEQQFNMAKSSMLMEIRSLESENARLKKELQAQGSSGENSDDSAFEKISLLLDNERAARKHLDVRLVELESLNVKLESEISALKKVNESLVDGTRNAVGLEEVRVLSDEIGYVKKCINSMAETFQGEYFKVMKNMESVYSTALSDLEASNTKLNGELQSFKSREKMARQNQLDLDSIRKSHNTLVNENENLRVSLSLVNVENEELKLHCKSLERAFSERELVLEDIKAKYSLAIGKIEERERELSELVESIKLQILTSSDSEINKLKEEISELSKQKAELNDALSMNQVTITELERENKRIKDLLGLFEVRLGQSRSNSKSSDEEDLTCSVPNIIQERLVSTMVVDKDALKALEWKNIVANKVPSHTLEARVVSEEDDSNNYLHNEISMLNLKLKQSERINEESKNLVEALRSCVSVVRKSKK